MCIIYSSKMLIFSFSVRHIVFLTTHEINYRHWARICNMYCVREFENNFNGKIVYNIIDIYINNAVCLIK